MKTLEDFICEARDRDRANGYRDSYRLLCGGVVISQVPSRLGRDFAMRLLENFRHHIINALTDRDGTWEFRGAGGVQKAPEWLRMHEERFGFKLSNDLRIVEPGPFYLHVENPV